MIELLRAIGLIYIDARTGKVKWPIHNCTRHIWLWKIKDPHNPSWAGEHRKFGAWFGAFHNRPGVVKWLPGRLLPARWGFYIIGIEIGDRGGTDPLFWSGQQFYGRPCDWKELLEHFRRTGNLKDAILVATTRPPDDPEFGEPLFDVPAVRDLRAKLRDLRDKSNDQRKQH